MGIDLNKLKNVAEDKKFVKMVTQAIKLQEPLQVISKDGDDYWIIPTRLEVKQNTIFVYDHNGQPCDTSSKFLCLSDVIKLSL